MSITRKHTSERMSKIVINNGRHLFGWPSRCRF